MTLAEPPASPGPGPIFRFAPSPNGHLHLGHAFSALLNHNMAQAAEGALLLRLEDIDVARCREEFSRSIEADLAWLGVAWRGEVRHQARHFAVYGAMLGRLEAMGLVYPCFCTRGSIASDVALRKGWARDPDGVPIYPGNCRHLDAAERRRRRAAGGPLAYRLDVGRALAQVRGPLDWLEYGEEALPWRVAADPIAWGDPLLARKDVPTSYHLAVVTDDAAQGVTDVVRGEDLFHATSLHRLLQALLGLPAPRYHHHRLILDPSGNKLSKSRKAPSLRALREGGRTPDEIRQMLGLA